MKERGMIFNAEMVRAILDGRKTQTRRIINPEPDFPQLLEARTAESGCVYAIHANRSNVHQGRFRWDCPFGQPGDRLWVRETFTGHYLDDDQIQDIKDGRDKASSLCEYRADYPDGYQAADGWTPSIHMPRWASRITLEITDVRVERLNDISEGGATAEGIRPAGSLLPDYPGTFLTPKGDFATAKVAFQRLWESIYGEENWKANPWVWVIEFKRVEGGAA
ncbi:hypothetical protein STW0522RAO56_31260 [Raoultella planticola]|nr:hypothetical protein STW0522RAO56_31260 [Raoultella planticola]